MRSSPDRFPERRNTRRHSPEIVGDAVEIAVVVAADEPPRAWLEAVCGPEDAAVGAPVDAARDENYAAATVAVGEAFHCCFR